MKQTTRKFLCATLTTAMLFSMAACGATTSAPAEPAKEETTVEAEAPAAADTAEAAAAAVTAEEAAAAATQAQAEETADAVYTNKGFTLTVPAKYDDLLFTTTPEEEDTLFVCSEIASIEAAQKQEGEYDYAGRLFSIKTIDEETLNQMLCGEMSGTESFATDGNGTYFLFCHPTDVTLVRENYDDPAAMEQWTELTEWAATVPDTFLADNPQLTAAKIGNTDLDIYLARIAFDDETKYTISTLEFLELEPKDVDPAPYLEKLRINVTYEPVDGEGPDGEYAVLAFPEDKVRFEFPVNTEDGCYVRQVWGENDEWTQVYKANFEDESINSTDVMMEWYDALAVANGKK